MHNLCYNHKCPTWFKYNLNHISYCAPQPCKPVFKGEFYQMFILFSIKAKHHVIGSNHRGGDL
jgi:hypothetical protein